jgi:sugar lactone lactonase YvrE
MAHDGSELRQLTSAGDTGIALDNDFVYFTSRADGRVHRMRKNGQELITLTSAPLANEVAVYGTLVAFTAQGDGLVRLVPNSGSEAIPIASGSDGVAIDSEGVYFTDADSERVGYVPNKAAPPGESIGLAVDHGRPRAIAVDQRRVYWTTDAPSSSVYKLVKSGPAFQ